MGRQEIVHLVFEEGHFLGFPFKVEVTYEKLDSLFFLLLRSGNYFITIINTNIICLTEMYYSNSMHSYCSFCKLFVSSASNLLFIREDL